MDRIFIGYDEREAQAYDVCVNSMRGRSRNRLHIEPLIAQELESGGIYYRPYDDIAGQRIDRNDGKAFSTDFAFTRFLVPFLSKWKGTALFCDSDFLWRADVMDLFSELDRRYAVQVVKHDFTPKESTKMRGQRQEGYPRKGWSSLCLWNLEHPANLALTPEVVNSESGRWLHGFGWLADDQIGALDPSWNTLEGIDDEANPKGLHYTRGTPDIPGFEDSAFADEWRSWQ